MKTIYLVKDFDDYYAFENLADAQEMVMQCYQDHIYQSYLNALYEYDWYQHLYFYRYIDPAEYKQRWTKEDKEYITPIIEEIPLF